MKSQKVQLHKKTPKETYTTGDLNTFKKKPQTLSEPHHTPDTSSPPASTCPVNHQLPPLTHPPTTTPPPPLPWPFFAPLDSVIGSVVKPSAKTPSQPPQRKRIAAVKPTPTPPPQRKRIAALTVTPEVAELPLPPPPSAVPVGRRSKRPPPPPYQPVSDSSFFRRNFSVMAAAAAAVDGAEEDSEASLSSGGDRNQYRNRDRRGVDGDRVRRLPEDEGEASGDAYCELAEAIGRFADVYKRVEETKQRQMVELEKQRMEFTKDLEIERMKLLMESQVQLRKLKRSKRNSDTDLCRSDDSASIS
ncbi:hypothetical protein HanRHA438_Chr17g0824421 [Helianthus annuus]|nr:hypothetical protein HanRHA438_Chr17g0824421 [Helianthus annuus]